jgi:hypothetical protein
MSILAILGIIVLFCVVLSWTDLQPHVGYAFHVSAQEGWYLFPVIWFQSFFMYNCFLKSGKSKMDFELLTAMERALRMFFSKDENLSWAWDKNRGNYFEISPPKRKTIRFTLQNDDSVEINGYDKLVPPRLAFQMMQAAKIMKRTANKDAKSSKQKKALYH